MKDTFINAGLLYEQLGGKIREAMDKVKSSHRRAKGVYDMRYFPEDLRQKQRWVIEESMEVLQALEDIRSILQTSAATKKQAIAIPDRKRIERMTVIAGGLYKPPARVDDCLSDKFRAFLEKERAEAEQAST
ncbi:MAG: hypothetical protein WCJ37_03550 [Syntrophus sp. (in: bacteria)]